MVAAGENPLLAAVPSETAAQYYAALTSNVGHGVEVRPDAGGERGKGVFAVKAFQSGEVIFAERPLAGIQHIYSKVEVSTCSHCFRAVGTVEEHFGGKICCLINELSEVTEEDELQQVQDKVDKIHAAVDSRHLEGLLSGSVRLPLTDKVDMAQPVPCRAGCGEEFCSSSCEAQAWEHYHCILCTAATDTTAAVTCSSSGSSSAIERGKAQAPPQKQQKQQHSCHRSAAEGRNSSSGASSSRRAQAVLHEVHGATINTQALEEFYEHADETNDIFRVAAQVIAQTIITANKLLQQRAADEAEDEEAQTAYDAAVAAASQPRQTQPVAAPQHQQQQAVLAAAEDQQAKRAYNMAAAAAAAAGTRIAARVLLPGDTQRHQQQQQECGTSACGSSSSSSSVLQEHLSALQVAFLPYALGHKALWWNIPLFNNPVTPGSGTAAATAAAAAGSSGADSDAADDAEELSAQMHELAAESLALLKKAIRDNRFAPLFDLQLYGSLIGMFELNNLALAISAPVGRYKHMLLHPYECGVDADDAAAALAAVTPLLEALGEAADQPAEGTGFFSLQSCINHSCQPNVTAECLPTGQMVVKAVRDIPAGSEVLLSYIEEADASLDERRQMLMDYGFVCGCDRCVAEELAQGLQAQTLQEL